MTLVVADTSPLNYLVLIGSVELLPRLYDLVVIPRTVFAELTHPGAPSAVRRWIATLPPWANVRSATHVDLGGILDPGEAEAIALAQELRADAELLDEAEGREEALRLGLPVSGTIGVLEKAAERGLLDLGDAFRRLAGTSIRLSPELLQQALSRAAARRQGKAPGREP
jgi:predicted nucleic acid-binding protein